MRWLVLIAWMALITYWSNQPSLPIDQPRIADAMHNFQHRAAHVLAYGLMGLLAWWATDGKPRAILMAIAITSIFGATDELHQSFIPGRRAAIDDWLLDTASAAAAIAITAKLQTTARMSAVKLVAPAVVLLAFAVGLGLAVRPALSSALALLRAS
jgi:VanZ family protein